MSFLNTLKAKVLHFGKKEDVEREEAITFSNTYDPGQNRDVEGMACCENQGKNLVVATLESRFAEDMVEYALEMADRMDFGIIAVNAANLTHDVTDFFSTTHEELYRDFRETAARNVVSFREKAAELGLKFAHTTRYSDLDHAIADVTKECGQIEFIITENREPIVTRDSNVNDNRIAQRLFVYAAE